MVWPSRLVLGKKFFWIWFIYTLEGCVLVLHFFILTKCHLWNTLVEMNIPANLQTDLNFLTRMPSMQYYWIISIDFHVIHWRASPDLAIIYIWQKQFWANIPYFLCINFRATIDAQTTKHEQFLVRQRENRANYLHTLEHKSRTIVQFQTITLQTMKLNTTAFFRHTLAWK